MVTVSRPSQGEERPARAPYFFQDPIRAAAMLCAGLLMVLRDVPFALAVLAIGVSQINGVAMLIDFVGRGWSAQWGRRSRESVLTNNLAIDWANTSVCTLTGAMLLMRFFGPPSLVIALGCVTLAVALIPDMRFCRFLLPEDPAQASRVLREGTFLRDPVKLGALAAMAIVCAIDRTSLAFVFLSMILLQLNSLLILVDKYLVEIETSSDGDGTLLRVISMMLERQGQRFLLAMTPMAMVPLRLGTDETVARWTAGIVAALIIVPDVLRLVARALTWAIELVIRGLPAKA